MGKEIALYVIIAHIREKCGRIECPLFLLGVAWRFFKILLFAF